MKKAFLFVGDKTFSLLAGVLFGAVTGVTIASEWISVKKWEMQQGKR